MHTTPPAITHPQCRVQGFYDTLKDHAQNMSVYPDLYNIMDTFLHGIPEMMCVEMFKNGLTPEANTANDFVAEGKVIEEATKTQDHYRQQVVVPVTWATNMAATPPRENRPRRVGVTLMTKSNAKNLNDSSNQKLRIYISAMN